MRNIEVVRSRLNALQYTVLAVHLGDNAVAMRVSDNTTTVEAHCTSAALKEMTDVTLGDYLTQANSGLRTISSHN